MGTAKVIRQIIDIYQIDRKYTKRYNMYYIKNTLSFVEYIYDSIYSPEDYEYGPNWYNEGKLIKINYDSEYEDEYEDDEYEYEDEDEFAI